MTVQDLSIRTNSSNAGPEISQRAFRSYLRDKTMESRELYGLPSRSRGEYRTGVFFGGRDFMTNQPTFFNNGPGAPYPIPPGYVMAGKRTSTSVAGEDTAKVTALASNILEEISNLLW
ncbi:MAG: hypothetical protein HYY37_03170 [Candidatus Aenigmarchaeota archaeon]|nr:hypothetical protein [Candidatus Aenigmarchaeota archaeon]